MLRQEAEEIPMVFECKVAEIERGVDEILVLDCRLADGGVGLQVWTLMGLLETLLAESVEEAVILADNIYLTPLGQTPGHGMMA